MPEAARIVFGLGNPGPQYVKTRHNIGFEVLDTLAAQSGNPWTPCRYAKAMESRLDEQTRLIKPGSYMNRSGEVVGKCLNWLKLGAADMLIVVDDIHLPLGQLRLRQAGSSGGHNGLRSIEEILGTRHYARLRAGVGAPEGQLPLSDFVLNPFREEERTQVEQMILRAIHGIRLYLDRGFEPAAEYTNPSVI